MLIPENRPALGKDEVIHLVKELVNERISKVMCYELRKYETTEDISPLIVLSSTHRSLFRTGRVPGEGMDMIRVYPSFGIPYQLLIQPFNREVIDRVRQYTPNTDIEWGRKCRPYQCDPLTYEPLDTALTIALELWYEKLYELTIQQWLFH